MLKYIFLYFSIINKGKIKITELIILFNGLKKFINRARNDKIITAKISCNENDLILLPFVIKYPYGVYIKVTKKLKIKTSSI